MQPAPVFETRAGGNDFALVMGVIGRGSGLAGTGAEARAQAFLSWLTAPTGAGVPPGHVHALIGRGHDIGKASLRQMLYELMPDLDDRLQSGGTAGRRCYLYLTGQAIRLPNEIRLLAYDKAARARVLDASFQRFVSFLRTTHVFDEVVAFADVQLLDLGRWATPQDPVFPSTEPVPRGLPAAAFAAVSAPLKPQRTRKLPATGATTDLVSYLGFTGAIVEGLTSAARDERGAITAESFVRWAGPRLREWLGDSSEMPRFEYDTQPPFVFFEAPVAEETERPVTPARMPNAYGLLIGVDDYVSIPRLSGCAEDARALARALGPTGAGYDPSHIHVLTDRDATRQAVAGELASLAEECNADSTLFVWFSGRAYVADGATTIFLADDSLESNDRGLSASQLKQALDLIRARHVVVVFDTSGGCAGLSPRPGRVLLSATLPDEDAYSGTGDTAGGDFTQAILRGLAGGAVRGGDEIDVFDVFEYAHAEVVRLGRQHPTIAMRWGEVGFPIAKRPLTPQIPSATDADGFVYDVHVVHSLQSPKADFVERELLPEMRGAGLRVAVSAPLETSPVPRVVQIERGILRSRRTLLLGSRSSHDEFEDVLRLALSSRPPLMDPSRLVIVALDEGGKDIGQQPIRGADDEPVLIETELYDLISAQTASDGRVQRLIEQLKQPVEPGAATRGRATRETPNVPLIEVASEGEPPRAWPLPPDDSAAILESASSISPVRAVVRIVMNPGDVVLLTDAVDPVRIVAVSRVLRAFKPAVVPAPAAGRGRSYDFFLPVRLSSPVVVSTDTVTTGSIIADVAATAIRSPASERDPVLSLLMPIIGRYTFEDLLSVARSVSDPLDRGDAVRSLVWQARERRLDIDDIVVSRFRDDPEPSLRALAPSTPSAEPPFTNACFFDAMLERNRIVKIGGTLGVQLQRWRTEPVYVHERDLAPFEQTVAAMRSSACIVLAWSSEMAGPEWRDLMREAVAIDEQRANHVASKGRTPTSTLVTLVIDGPAALPAELTSRPTIDATGLTSASDETMIERVTAQLLDAVLASCQVMSEDPPATPAPITREEALDRIGIEIGDLRESDADAIVNAVGVTAMSAGNLGVELAERLGDAMLAVLERHGSLVAGETRVSLSGGRIPARYVVHTCTEDHRGGHTVESVVVGALGAIRTAESLPSVRRLAFPALGSGAAGIPPRAIAEALVPAVVDQLTRGSSIERVRFVFRSDGAAQAYRDVLDDLRAPATATADSIPGANADRWYVSLRQTTIGSVYVGGTASLGLFFSLDEQPDAVPLIVPYSAFELTAYIDATTAFSLDGSSQQTVQVRDGYIDNPSVPLRLVALSSGTYTVRVTVNARGARTSGIEAVVTCPVRVEAPILLPDIPELIDRRTIPPPHPDVVLYVATEPTARSQRLRFHITCPALGYDRRRIDDPLPLDSGDTAAIRLAAADIATELDPSSPPDARAAILAFGAMLYDVLMPPGHELRAIVTRLLELPTHGNQPVTWLIASDEAAALPWELVVPHGYGTDAAHWYDECLATRFVVAHWISRRGFIMANEVPIGPIGVVHYGQHPEAHERWRDAIGAGMASDADRHPGLDILRRGSPFFGVHLLRFTDAAETGQVAEVTDAGEARGAHDSLTGERRLDFTLRRPLVSLSLVDASLERGRSLGQRYTNIEQAWAVPFLLARSSAVVGPRWTTAPSSDRVFCRAFYDALRADRPLGLAVWEARETLRLAYPDRADWLAYTYFGHPWCEPYPVETAEGFTLFEPMSMTTDQPFVAGRDYLFRASFRGELPAWYNGRRHRRTARLHGDGVRVLVAALHGGDAVTYGLIAANGADAVPDEDVYAPVILSMPREGGTYKWFVQFTRGEQELRSSVITLDVVDDETALELRLAENEREVVAP